MFIQPWRKRKEKLSAAGYIVYFSSLKALRGLSECEWKNKREKQLAVSTRAQISVITPGIWSQHGAVSARAVSNEATRVSRARAWDWDAARRGDCCCVTRGRMFISFRFVSLP